MKKDKTATQRCFRKGFMQPLTGSNSKHHNSKNHKTHSCHDGLPPHIKDMWDIYLGFTQLEL